MKALPKVALAGLVATAGLVAMVPAFAGPVSPLRATGPTNVHNADFSNVTTNVHVVNTGSGKTIITLDVAGLPDAVDNTTLGAHVHVDACGVSSTASGGHYQNPNPPLGATLADKEVWLDLDVNSAGRGRAQAVADWTINAGDAESIVVHALPTNPATGAAGARLFCTNVAFGG
jgi:Cu-Zn family superoxide dismutase